jgi:DNA-binding LacI/PurR family transcriptional regulator
MNIELIKEKTASDLTGNLSRRIREQVRNKSKNELVAALENGMLCAFREIGLASGTHLPGNSTMAKEIGISHVTLRKALKELEGKGVLQQIHGKGTFLRKDYAKGGKISGTIAVLLPHLKDNYSSIVDAIGQEWASENVKICFENISWRENQASRVMEIMGINDLTGIICSPSIHPEKLIKEIEFYRQVSNSVPVVFIDRAIECEGISSVGFDDAWGMELIFDHVWGKGFRDIYYLHPDIISINVRNEERCNGFKAAAAKHGYNIDGKFFALQETENQAYAKILIKLLLEQSEKNTAFICGNERAALRVQKQMDALKPTKKVMVTGYDRIKEFNDHGQEYPSSHRCRALLGATAAQLLKKIIQNRRNDNFSDENIVLKPEMIL